MPKALVIMVAVEGLGDEPIVRRILRELGLDAGPIYNTRGKPNLDARLSGYNNAAKTAPWLVLRDLDTDASCAPEIRQQLLPHPSRNMCFRLAVRSAEAWLMGDREKLSEFLAVPLERIPDGPETVQKPKRFLIDLARQSRQRAIRDDMVPANGTTAQVGPLYVQRISEFANEHWRPKYAARRCDSLRRCIAALERWT